MALCEMAATAELSSAGLLQVGQSSGCKHGCKIINREVASDFEHTHIQNTWNMLNHILKINRNKIK